MTIDRFLLDIVFPLIITYVLTFLCQSSDWIIINFTQQGHEGTRNLHPQFHFLIDSVPLQIAEIG